ncbi:MAG: 50S ribosomal protein L35 [Oscillospiraceae bacterium]|jgi:large subunit ribosomal protein L35|nr:50S ribosomal protein L35 [Oscillospiraceae bacterium]
MKNKIKTHSGAKKRFKLTKTGRVKYQQVNRRHRLTQKDSKRKRINRGAAYIDQSDEARVKTLIPYK